MRGAGLVRGHKFHFRGGLRVNCVGHPSNATAIILGRLQAAFADEPLLGQRKAGYGGVLVPDGEFEGVRLKLDNWVAEF